MIAVNYYGQPSDAAVNIVAIMMGVTLFIGYVIPSVVAVARRMPNTGAVIVVDLFLGWTVVGWIVAMAMACGSKPQRAPFPPPYGPPTYGPPPPPFR